MAFCHGDAPPLQPLQCGHGSKAVEIGDIPQVKTLGDIVLQCGHGSKAVEIMSLNRLPGATCHASMRPRLQGRGDYYPESLVFCTLTMLQCGHGSKAVEISTPFKTGGVYDWLQCGHGSKAVEIRRFRCTQ